MAAIMYRISTKKTTSIRYFDLGNKNTKKNEHIFYHGWRDNILNSDTNVG